MGLVSTLAFLWRHPMNAGGRVAAVARLARWQLGSRVLPDIVALPFVDDTRLFARRGMTGVTGNWYCGLHEFAEMAFALHFLRPTDCFVDIGANVGSYTVIASGAVGARTIAVEPVPETFGRLQMNVRLNGLDAAVRCWQGGLSGAPGMLRFTTKLDTVNHVLGPDETGPFVEVPVTTLDDLVGEDVPTLLKIDVEGHEAAVLAGGSGVLRDERLHAVIMEVNGSGARYGIDDCDLLSTMLRHGFHPCRYDPVARLIKPDSAHGPNVVFVRDLTAAQARVTSAPHFRLVNGKI